MKYTTILFLLFLSFNVSGQDQYTDGMQKAFQHWKANETDQSVALFERIAQAETEKWEPLYHAANVLIATSFSLTENADKFAILEKAKDYIKMAHERSVDNSEIVTLEGMLYTGYVAAEPETFAMQYSSKIMNLHSKAIELNPNNPRAISNQIEYEMGSARFFGQDLEPYCKRLQETIVIYNREEESDSFAPRHGQQRIQDIIDNCGK